MCIQHVSVMGAVPTLDLSKPAMVAAAGSPTAGSHPPEVRSETVLDSVHLLKDM